MSYAAHPLDGNTYKAIHSEAAPDRGKAKTARPAADDQPLRFGLIIPPVALALYRKQPDTLTKKAGSGVQSKRDNSADGVRKMLDGVWQITIFGVPTDGFARRCLVNLLRQVTI